MATISDTLYAAGVPATSVQLVFDTADSPIATGSGIHSACRKTLITHATTGAFSIALPEGEWRMRWRIGKAWNELSLQVPSGSSTYEISELEGATADVSRIEYPYFATIELAEAANILGSRVDVGVDGNGVMSAKFVRNDSFAGELDGVSGFEDAVGHKFERFQQQ